ncbi:MAG: DUF4230 domain-containing protein [Verrucomicrobiales bacterium]
MTTALILAVLGLVGGAVWWLVFVYTPRKTVETVTEAADSGLELAKRSASAIKDVFKLNPSVMLSDTVIYDPSKEILELAILEKRFKVQHTFTHGWLGSIKEVSAEADFVAKIGYDLGKGFRMNIKGKKAQHGLDLILPQPKVLSLEQLEIKIKEDAGWWNRVADEDRTAVLNQLRVQAQEQVKRMNLILDAEEQTRKKMEESLKTQLGELRLPRGLAVKYLENPS